MSALVVADAFSSSRRGRNSSRTVPVLINPDSDNDGMSDVWELQFGLNRFLGSDGTLDGDGDGMSNLDEFRAGLNPTNAASVLRLQAVAVSGTGIRVRFNVGGGRNWSLLRADSLARDAVWSLVTNGFTGATEETAEVEVSGGQVAFFKVVVTGP